MGLGSVRCSLVAMALLAVAHHANAEPAGTFDWTGLYIGANGGFGTTGGDGSLTAQNNFAEFYFDNDLLPHRLANAPRGALGGATVGYNVQAGDRVLGVEADFAFAAMSRSSFERRTTFGIDYDTASEAALDSLGTLRLRAGAILPAGTLAYVTGGLAYGHASLASSIDMSDDIGPYCGPAGICAADSASAWKLGWTAGAGLEHQLSPGWTAKAELLYYDLGEMRNELQDTHTEFDRPIFDVTRPFAGVLARVGLNYRLP